MVGDDDLPSVIARRPPEMANLTAANWNQLTELWDSGAYDADFDGAFRNGRAFLAAADALNGRRPRIIEWTGGRRPPGDEVVPSDLRVDHVYLISCKYLSRILHNSSPARLIEGLLTQTPVDDLRDWYHRVAPVEYQELYEVCVPIVDGAPLPERVTGLTTAERRRLMLALRAGWPPGAADKYDALCRSVSRATAEAWNTGVTSRNAESTLWRLLRIGSTPYFILGATSREFMRLRIDTPWDWRHNFRLRRFEIEAQLGGQPRVGWAATCVARHTREERVVRGHVEIRWSHGRFGQPPEAKVYLDTAHEDVPGYNQLRGDNGPERSVQARR